MQPALPLLHGHRQRGDCGGSQPSQDHDEGEWEGDRRVQLAQAAELRTAAEQGRRGDVVRRAQVDISSTPRVLKALVLVFQLFHPPVSTD